jgi:hypothetical protein
MSNDLLNFSKLPTNFQEELFRDVAKILNRGESMQLYGAPGSGNSLIAKVLMQSQEIREKHFEDNMRFLLIDANLLLERSPLGLSRFFFAMLTAGEIQSSDTVNLYSLIEQEIQKICDTKNLVIIIDHMQELSSPELKPFFVNLYNIYRKLEPKLNFIFIFNKKIESNSNLANFGLIGRLITQNIIKVSSFNNSDANWFIEEKEKQLGFTLPTKVKELVIKLSGGYPRTIKRLAESIGRKNNINELTENPSIDSTLNLHLEELTQYHENLPIIPLLEKYLEIRNKTDGEMFGNVKLLNKLTKNEEKVLIFLIKNKGEIVEREKGIEQLWGKNAIEVSDHAYDQIIHRLRNKLKGSTPKAEIQTVKGRGHVFID